MIEKMIYVANDGTEFDSEHQCILYETHCRKEELGDTFIAFGEYGDKIDDIEYYWKTYILVIKNKETYDFIRENATYFGYSYPNESDLVTKDYCASFWYDENSDKWIDIDKKVEKLKENIEFLEKFSIDKY